MLVVTILAVMKRVNYLLILLMAVSLFVMSGCGRESGQKSLQLSGDNLKRVLTDELGGKTSYGAQRISMAKVGRDLETDQKNATTEVLGPINFDRFATVRFAIDKGNKQDSRKQGLLEDMSTIYQICFSKFDQLNDLLIFAEFDFGEEGLKSVALSHMSRRTAKEIKWDNFSPAKITGKANYFEWIRNDL